MEHMFAHVRDEGKVLLFGVAPANATININPYQVFQKDLQIIGSFALRYTFHQAIGLLQSGAVNVGPLLSERMPIGRFPEALKLAGSGEVLKVQIHPE
jgi:NADPH2:quinone reductase